MGFLNLKTSFNYQSHFVILIINSTEFNNFFHGMMLCSAQKKCVQAGDRMIFDGCTDFFTCFGGLKA
jgi:hypothetical protein